MEQKMCYSVSKQSDLGINQVPASCQTLAPAADNPETISTFSDENINHLTTQQLLTHEA